jgi:hypothetical protein
MGRPIKKIYIGNRNPNGVGGEGVESVTILDAGTGYFSANAAVTFSAPQLPGTTAIGTVELDLNGNVTGVVITSSGTGYTSAPTALFTGANTSPATANVVTLTTSVRDAIAVSAYIPGGASAKVGDIVAQKGTKTYRVTTADGTGECTLVTTVPTEGQMRITATDSAGGTYFVKKLFNQTVVVVPGTGTQFAEDAKVDWTALDTVNGGYVPVTTPVENVSVTIIN